jgi:hypothetical protein
MRNCEPFGGSFTRRVGCWFCVRLKGITTWSCPLSSSAFQVRFRPNLKLASTSVACWNGVHKGSCYLPIQTSRSSSLPLPERKAKKKKVSGYSGSFTPLTSSHLLHSPSNNSTTQSSPCKAGFPQNTSETRHRAKCSVLMRPYSPEMEGFGPESLQPEQGVPTQDSKGGAAASERHKYEQRVRSDAKALFQRLYDEENASRLAAHLRRCGAPQPSAGSGGSLDPSTTFRGIQRQHMTDMPNETQSLFLWDDAILFKPRKQPETPTTETESDAKKTDSLICVACIADWLLAVFATFVVWTLYWTCHLWFAAQELPPHVMEFPVHPRVGDAVLEHGIHHHLARSVYHFPPVRRMP